MAEEDPVKLEELLLDAFEPFASREAAALRRILAATLLFASYRPRPSPDRPGLPSRDEVEFIIISRRALLTAIIADGVKVHQKFTASAWLAEWLDSVRADVEPLLTAASNQCVELASMGVPIRVSDSLMSRVLPAARELALATVNRDRCHLRHILFPLLDEPTAQEVVPALSTFGVDQLKGFLAKRIIDNHEPTEKVDPWLPFIPPAATVPPPTPGPPAPPPPTGPETVRTLADAPATVDSLGRQAFAEVLAKRIREIESTWPKDEYGRTDISRGGDSSFVLHIDGPWGSGKSSVLNFLKADLAKSPKWLVVEFNAWRHQDRKPPWWPLIATVHDAQIGLDARMVRFWWRIRMDWAPYLTALGLLTLAGLLAWFALNGAGATDPAARAAATITRGTGEALAGLLAVFGTIGGIVALVRGLMHGSSRNAEVYLETRKEPFGRIVHHFECLIREIGRPIAVFIDDLDRCDSGYVVELLEGIQTLLRSAPVVYVVAGDRKWICSSFEKRYADFCGEIGEPGRPLGYLFLDKVFQLSTSIPQLPAERQKRYWRELLEKTDSGAAAEDETRRKDAEEAAEAEAEQEVRHMTQHEQYQVAIDAASNDSVKQEALRAAVAKQISSPEAVRATEHRLAQLAHLLEANPRSMKRLVNAYGLNHARSVLEGRRIEVEALVRWTIIELRWPLLADHFADNWPNIANRKLRPEAFPAEIRELLAKSEVREVIGSPGQVGHLAIATLDPILGSDSLPKA